MGGARFVPSRGGFVPDLRIAVAERDPAFDPGPWLQALLDRPVDLIEASAVKNPYIWKSIEASRETLYAA